MPKSVEHEYACILTNDAVIEPKPSYAVISLEAGHLVMKVNGEPQTLPEGFKLYIKGRIAAHILKYAARKLEDPKKRKPATVPA